MTAVDALLLVDLQDEHVAPLTDPAPLLDAVSVLLASARAAGSVVVHLRNSPDPFALPPADGEHVVHKHEDDGFAGTELEQLLGLSRRVVVAGLLSEMCVAATARGALVRGHHVVLVSAAHATYDVPPGPGGSPAVPAALAARAAEWSLGEQVEVVGHPADVTFLPR